MKRLNSLNKPSFINNLLALVAILASLIAVSLATATPAEAKAVKPQWFAPYYDNTAVLELPADDQVAEQFSFTGELKSNYRAVLVKVNYKEEEVYYYYPAQAGKVAGKVYLRFGQGTYRVEFNLVKPGTDPSTLEFDNLAIMDLEQKSGQDQRYLAPSWGIESDNQEILKLAGEITKGQNNDYQKVRAIHDWVSSNIQYDVKKYTAKEFYDNQGAVQTLRNKKGLCRDYANLVTALLRASGLEARTVLGKAGGNGNWYDHAWNEALVGGRWVALDATWDAGNLKNGQFTNKFSRKYFDMSGDLLVTSHKSGEEVY